MRPVRRRHERAHAPGPRRAVQNSSHFSNGPLTLADMKTIRAVHLYLGCAFAPLLAFYIFSGFLQTFDFHEARKDGSYTPPRWALQAGSIHMHQRLQPEVRGQGGP